MLRRFRLWALTAIAVLPCGAAFAAIVPTATLVSDPPTTPFLASEAALGAPWKSYQLSLVATEGEQVGGVDVNINGVHQRWTDSDFDSFVDPSPIGAAANGRGDSHLTPSPGAPIHSWFETNRGFGTPLPNHPVAHPRRRLASTSWAVLAK